MSNKDIKLPPKAKKSVKEKNLGLTGSKELAKALDAVGPKKKPNKDKLN